MSNNDGKRLKRQMGNPGRKPQEPELEEALMVWFKEQRAKKHVVIYLNMGDRALTIMGEMGIGEETLKISDSWLRKFCKRHSISSRKITHHGQQDKRDLTIQRMISYDHLRGVKQLTAGLGKTKIFNMDETPCYIDMAGEKTLDFVGSKNVDGLTTGHDKNHFTVVLCICLDGRILKAMVILKNLVNVPKCTVPKNIELFVSKGGSMNEDLMLSWIDKVFKSRGSYFASEPSLLLMDSHKSHYTDPVVKALKSLNIITKLIPPKTTSYLQP